MNRVCVTKFKYFTYSYHSSVGVYGFKPRSFQPPAMVSEKGAKNRICNSGIYQLAVAFQDHGHKIASLNPLENCNESFLAELDPSRYGLDTSSKEKISLVGITHAPVTEATVADTIQHLKNTYCNKIGVEIQHLNENEKDWFSKEFEKIQVENMFSNSERKLLANELVKSQTFDNFLATKFSTVKRYGGEGAESMMAFFMEIFKQSCLFGLSDVVIGIPHRGRLNLLTGLLKFPPVAMFQKMMGFPEFPDETGATGDVLSHLTSSIDMEYEKSCVHVTLLPNPSHLEAVSPVVVGYARSQLQSLSSGDYCKGKEKSLDYSVLPVQVHGDASFSGQGVVMETLAMSNVSHFYVGGSIHLIVNNQIGFTTPQDRGRSSPYCSDLIKMISAPVIHVNGDYPEEVAKASKLAMCYRQLFQKDVIIDLLCFRRWGHNELDDPTFTNPSMYKTIHSRKSVPDLYTGGLIAAGIISETERNEMVSNHHTFLSENLKQVDCYKPQMCSLQKSYKIFNQSQTTSVWDTGIPIDVLKFIGTKSVTFPENMIIHPTLAKNFVQERKKKLDKGNQIDWATAEAIAIGSLLYQGHNVRLSGQDVGRGTFSHRHAMMIDQSTDEIYVPLNHLTENQNSFFEVANSILSEEGVLGFEYGFSVENLNNLVIWEAQFGDFFNSAQVVFDTCISSGETKWLLQSGMIILLPHGYDGAGPEHSSCRLERFLQMSDSHEDQVDSDDINWQVVNPTSPAQYFHLIRKQVMGSSRKPMIIVAPKILLRHPMAVSALSDMTPQNHFRPVLKDATVNPSDVKTIIFCSGKHFYLLQKERESRKRNNVAIIRLEALCPFPTEKLMDQMKIYKNATSFVWSQEEHQNMGAWAFVKTRFENMLGCKLKYAGRKILATPAVGVGKFHQQEITDLLNKTFM